MLFSCFSLLFLTMLHFWGCIPVIFCLFFLGSKGTSAPKWHFLVSLPLRAWPCISLGTRALCWTKPPIICTRSHQVGMLWLHPGSAWSCLTPSWQYLELGEHGINTALSFLGQRKQQMEQDDKRYGGFWCRSVEFVTSCWLLHELLLASPSSSRCSFKPSTSVSSLAEKLVLWMTSVGKSLPNSLPK